jgi:heparan-alpha-glucosaminide N-acetyltransferase
MATLAAPPVAASRSAPQATAAPLAGIERLLSLDVFRGLTMILLISHGFGIREALRNTPSLAWFSYQFEHVSYAGCTLWDLIQPAFTFIVGVALPLSASRRMAQGATRSELFRHVLWRAFILLALSNVLSNWNSNQAPKLQFINVLCQIAFSYVLCFAILQLRFVWQAVAAVAIMVFHHALFLAFPGPEGAFALNGNIGAVIDKNILGYNYSGGYTTINFLGNAITVLFGVWTGMMLEHYREHRDRLRILVGCSLLCFGLGIGLEFFIPMVKRLWLGSFTFFSAGGVLLAFAACYSIVEVKGWRRWAFPATVVGMNCIFIYSFTQVLHGWLSRGVANFDRKFSFLGDYGAIPHNLVVLGIMWYMCYWLYQRRIFFKI